MVVKKFVNRKDFSCNVFVCSGEKANYIVDLGYYDSHIDQYLASLPKIDFVLQTHGHFDHIMGLNDFHEKYPEVPVYIYESEVTVAKNGINNGSELMLYDSFIPELTFKTFKEGMLRLCGYDFKVLHTPGHTQGSCMFYLEEEKVLFTGDTIIETSIGRTDLPTGDEAIIYRSLAKFKTMTFPEDTIVYCGHGEDYTYKSLIKHNPFLR